MLATTGRQRLPGVEAAMGKGCRAATGAPLSSISCSGTVPIQRPHHPVTLQRQTHRELKMHRRLLAHSAPLLQLGTPHPRIPPIWCTTPTHPRSVWPSCALARLPPTGLVQFCTKAEQWLRSAPGKGSPGNKHLRPMTVFSPREWPSDLYRKPWFRFY